MKYFKLTIVAATIMFASGCADERQAELRCSIENTDKIVGLTRHTASRFSTRLHRFMVLECASSDLFAAVLDAHIGKESVAEVELPRGCTVFFGPELTHEQLEERINAPGGRSNEKSSTAAVPNVLDGITSFDDGFSLVEVSSLNKKHINKLYINTNLYKKLSKIPWPRKGKKILKAANWLLLLVNNFYLLAHNLNKHRKNEIENLSRRNYSSSKHDQEALLRDHKRVMQLLMESAGEKGDEALPDDKHSDRPEIVCKPVD